LLNTWLKHAGNTASRPYYNGSRWLQPGVDFIPSGWSIYWRQGGSRPLTLTQYYVPALGGYTINALPTSGYSWPASDLEATIFTTTALLDRYKISGNYASSVTAYPSAAATPDVVSLANQQVWLRYWMRDLYYQNNFSSAPTIPDNCRPLYYSSSGELTAMTDAEIDENFIIPVLQKFVSTQPFLFSSATSIAEYTRWPMYRMYDSNLQVTQEYVARDTRANTAAYSSDLTSTQSSTEVITTYYLYGRTSYPYSLTRDHCLVASGDGVQLKSWEKVFDGWAARLLWYATNPSSIYYIAYNFKPTTSSQTSFDVTVAGTTETYYKYRHLGTYTDSRLNSYEIKTRFVNADDYRSQEWPSGDITATVDYFYAYMPNYP